MTRNVAQLVKYPPTMHESLRFSPHYHRHDGILSQSQNPGGEGKRRFTVIFFFFFKSHSEFEANLDYMRVYLKEITNLFPMISFLDNPKEK